MKNLKKRIISIFLVLVMVLTMLPADMGADTAKAADTTGSLSFTYRYGTETLIQVNTNLPSDTPCASFTADQNGCSIDQSGNTAQWVGWIGMDNVDGTIVLSFHFNSAFTAGQTYVLPQGAIFGFTDNTTYKLDGNYTFTFDGSSWTMGVAYNTENCSVLSFGGGNTYLQPVLDIPYSEGVSLSESSSIKDEKSTVTLGAAKWGGLFKNGNNTLVSVNLSAEEGDTYIWEKGSVFSLSNGKSYELDATYVFTFSETGWTMAKVASVISFGGANSYLQPVLDIPYVDGVTLSASSSIKDENSTVTLGASKWGGLFKNGNNTLVSVNLSAEEGETYVWGKGSIFVLSNGDSYILEKTYVFTYQNGTWTMESFDETEIVAERELAIPTVYGDVMQFGNFYDFGLSAQGTLSFEGTVLLDGEEVTVDGSTVRFDGYSGTTTIALYISDFTNKVLTIEAGSVISYNGVGVRISKTFNAKYDGTNWEIIPVIVAERELAVPAVYGDVMQFGNFYDFGLSSQGTLSFEGTVLLDGEEVIVDGSTVRFDGYHNTTTIALYISDFTNKVLTIEAGSVISYNGVGVKVSKTFNMMYNGTSWTEIDYIYSDVEGDVNGDETVDSRDLIRLKKVVNKAKDANNQCDLDLNEKYNGVDVHYLRLIILYGSISNLDVLDPLLYMGGEEFVSFADIPVNGTDTSKIAEYKALGFNTSLLTEDYAGTATDDCKATVVESNPIEVSDNILKLERLNYSDGKTLQLITNLSTDGTYADFLASSDGYSVKESGTQNAGYFEMNNSDGQYVYFTPHFNDTMTHGNTYVLGAGSEFTFNGTKYVLDRTYTFTFKNNYLTALENLDAAGLNVWIRNHSNTADYFTDDITTNLKKYADVIDGFYIVDEPFMTEELYTYSKEKYDSNETTVSFDSGLPTLVTWFNNNFANMYFHVNHVPISSYNHYGKTGDSAATASNYQAFLNTYAKNVLNGVDTTLKKKTIGYDNYPFGYTKDETDTILGIFPSTTTVAVTEGIIPNHLLNMLVAANEAKNNGMTFSTCIQTFNNVLKKPGTTTVLGTREVTTSAEVSFQLYTAMACGADMFEYFTYNSGSGFEGIMNSDGTGRIYGEVKEANTNAFAFADVINVFDWQGTQVSRGTNTNKNSTGIASVENSGLDLLIDNSSNGVLSDVTSDDDALVGYYTKGSQAGYMVANYNDPKDVTTNNSVTLTFAGCTKARVYKAEDGELTSEVVDLTNGSYTCEVAPGDGCFIIPVDAE